MILTVDYSEVERRILAHHFQEGDSFERLGTIAHRILEKTMIEKDATMQAAEAKIAVGGPEAARKAETAASGLASRVDRPIGRDPNLAAGYGTNPTTAENIYERASEGILPRVPRRPED